MGSKNLFNDMYGFNRDYTAGYDHNSAFYDVENMDAWEAWAARAYSDTSRNVDAKSRKNRDKKAKREKGGGATKHVPIGEFYAKLNRHGQTEINIEGDDYKVEFQNGTLVLTKL